VSRDSWPTGGIDTTDESIKVWSEAGVACVGIGSKLILQDSVAVGNRAEITVLGGQDSPIENRMGYSGPHIFPSQAFPELARNFLEK
jgi:hypothetical protein